jgi:tRNA nucleotidyltransferase (CCA-adding enzyme)
MTDSTVVTVPANVKPLLERIGRAAQLQRLPAYAVGGCVRDWLLGQTQSLDLDVMVEGDGVAFARALGRELGVGVLAHEQFGTATLTIESVRLDVASCRKETYAAPAAYPKVEPARLQDDLFRRDFTINAMAIALAPERFGQLVDPFHGLEDLRAKRLRVLHPKSFVDDPSRILRAARFVPRFDCSLDPDTERALRQAGADGLLERLNRGRLRRELEHLAEESNPWACLRCLAGWLAP